MRSNGRGRIRRLEAFVVAMLVWAALAVSGGTPAARAQEPLPPPPLPVDPTPLRELITDSERARLEKERKPKKQVERYLEISQSHLDAALEATRSQQIPLAERELDVYNKAIAEAAALAFAQRKDRRKLSKKIEQVLLQQIRTLELIERIFPLPRLPFAEAAVRMAKQTRIRALNEAFATGEVLKDPTKVQRERKASPGSEGAGSRQRRPSTLAFAAPVAAPQIPGDYLNEEEDGMVRSAQEPDKRVRAFMKIADRRLLAVVGVPEMPLDKKSQKKKEEEEREWGIVPNVGAAELLKHYARAIDEAIAKLEDAHERNPKDPAITKALVILRDATDKHLEMLRSLSARMQSESEMGALREAVAAAEVANSGAREGLGAR